MATDLVLAAGGMAMLVIGMCRMQDRASRKPITILLCVCGIVLIATGAERAGSGWGLRIEALGLYSTAGFVAGVTTATIRARRHAGAILASLGIVAKTGYMIMSAVAVSGGMLGVFIQALDTRRSSSLFMLVGQTLFFSALGVQALMMARTQWRFADQGILGPDIFVSWQQVSGWHWQDPDTLAIALKPGFLHPPRFTIFVAPEARERAAAILASKLVSSLR